MRTVLAIILIVSSYGFVSSESLLIGDRGPVVPEKQLVSSVYIREELPVIESSVICGVVVESSLEYDGVEQSKESMEKAGFYSIVTAKDI